MSKTKYNNEFEKMLDINAKSVMIKLLDYMPKQIKDLIEGVVPLP